MVPRIPGIDRSRARILAATLLCAVAAGAAGCGTSAEQFTQSEADKALAALDSIQSLIDDGRCKAAQRRVQLLIDQASKINRDRPDLGAAYAKSAERLQQLVARECVEIKEATSPTGEVTGTTGADGPTSTPEPTATPEPPAPEPTGGGAPVQPDTPNQNQNGNGNGNGTAPDSGGVRPQ